MSYRDWVNLGIPEKVAATAVSYVKKGGRFTSPDDLLKVYGFKQEDLERIRPFIRIATAEKQDVPKEEQPKIALVASGQLDINKITVAELENCGLRQQAAWSVINYRDKLGGYYSAQQFEEIKGLESTDLLSLLQCVQVNGNNTRKLRINSAGFTELANHPYLSDKLARAIIHYRDSTGNFISVNEISRAYRISPQYLEKLKYYLSL
jgi:DNA uptake protein ComE-like DNA-binding protein